MPGYPKNAVHDDFTISPTNSSLDTSNPADPATLQTLLDFLPADRIFDSLRALGRAWTAGRWGPAEVATTKAWARALRLAELVRLAIAPRSSR